MKLPLHAVLGLAALQAIDIAPYWCGDDGFRKIFHCAGVAGNNKYQFEEEFGEKMLTVVGTYRPVPLTNIERKSTNGCTCIVGKGRRACKEPMCGNECPS